MPFASECWHIHCFLKDNKKIDINAGSNSEKKQICHQMFSGRQNELGNGLLATSPKEKI